MVAQTKRRLNFIKMTKEQFSALKNLAVIQALQFGNLGIVLRIYRF